MSTLAIQSAPLLAGSLSWQPAPSRLEASGERVDLWRIELENRRWDLPGAEVLSADELARARRYRLERDRLRYLRCRAALRTLLGRYVGSSPAGICFEYEAAGKPALAARQNARQLCFNLSHADALAVVAVTAARRIGIDLEPVREEKDCAAIIGRYFSARERRALLAMPERERTAAFYACWTRKEAWSKALGEGLSFPLADFSVSTDPDSAAALEEVRGSEREAKRWSLADVDLAPGYRAALAVEGAVSQVAAFSL